MRYGIIGKYGLAALLMSAAAVFEIRADRFDILSGDAAACNGALTESALGDLWQQNIRPETAAHRLLYLMSFQTVPSPFIPDFSVLQYQLGHTAAHARQVWTPEFTAACNAMQRYIALFETLSVFPRNTPAPLILAGLPAGEIPLTDCLPASGATTAPQWTGTAGTVFTGTLLALPRRPLEKIGLSLGAPTGPDGKPAVPDSDMVLMALRYHYDRTNGWMYEPVSPEKCRMDEGIQVYLLKIKLPPSLAPGLYQGSVKAQIPDMDRTIALPYQLTIAAAPATVPAASPSTE